jgi:hypothetical protein
MFLAYKYVAVAVMLAEANFLSDRLQLPIGHPIHEYNLSRQLVFDPIVFSALGAGGRIDTDQYAFSFVKARRYIIKLHSFEGKNMADENEILSRGTSQIDTNGAYLLASNWLSLIQVDVRELEKTNYAEVRQRFYYGAMGQIKLPVFEVRWGDWQAPKIEVSIDGRTKEIVYIRQEDDSFSRRPEELIKNLDRLLEITDEDFQKFSDLQRSNLVAEYAVVDILHPADVPASISHRLDFTNNYELIFQKYSRIRGTNSFK